MVEGAARLPLFCILTTPCPRRTIREAPYATRFFALQKPPAHRLLPANYRMPGANYSLVGSNDSLSAANDRAMHSWRRYFLAYASILQALLPLFLFAESRELTIFVLIYTLMIHRLLLHRHGQAFMPRSAGSGKHRDNGKKRRDPDDEAVLRPQGQTP